MQEKLNYLNQELKKLNNATLLESMNKDLVDFLYQSLIHKKGYILIYHESDFRQKYEFDFNPMIVLSLKEFEELKNVFIFPVEYKIVPLLLADGHYYKKLKNMTNLTVGKPLLFNEEDIKTLVKTCRKENCINIWIMHPTQQKQLFNNLKNSVSKEDIVLTIDDEIHFDENKAYHVVVLLMSEGNHYHELLEKLPECVSVSGILPHQKEVRKMIEEKNK